MNGGPIHRNSLTILRIVPLPMIGTSFNAPTYTLLLIRLPRREAGGINVHPGCPTLPSPNPQLKFWLSTIVIQSDLERVERMRVAMYYGSVLTSTSRKDTRTSGHMLRQLMSLAPTIHIVGVGNGGLGPPCPKVAVLSKSKLGRLKAASPEVLHRSLDW